MGGLDPKRPEYEHHMMEALWVQQWHNRVDRAAAEADAALARPVGAGRRDARPLLLARPRSPTPLALLKVQANDDIPAVRLKAVRAASFFQTSDAAVVALEASPQSSAGSGSCPTRSTRR